MKTQKNHKSLEDVKRERGILYVPWKSYTKINSRGITMISLVVTVIVLLILASISISMLTGNNRNYK